MKLTKRQIWQIVGACALCAVMIVALLLGLYYGLGSIQPTSNPTASVDDIDPLVINCESTSDIMLTSGVATTASDGTITKSLTASVQPEGAEAVFNWGIAWANASSAWASGKSVEDYVSIAMSDSSNRISLVCSQAFGEHIVVTATSAVDESKSAQCTLDYEKRIINFTIGIEEKTAGTVSAINFSDDTLEYTFTATPSYGVGTITPTGTTSVTYKFTDAFRNAINYTTVFNGLTDALTSTVDASSHDISDSLLMKNWASYNNVRGQHNNSLGWLVYDPSALKAAYGSNGTYSLLEESIYTTAISTQKKALQSYSGNVLQFTYSFTSSNGNTYNATKYVGKGTAEFSSLNVTSVSLNSSNLVF